MTNTRTQSNLRLLKSRNQREGWYAGLKWKKRTWLKGRTLKTFVELKKLMRYAERISHE